MCLCNGEQKGLRPKDVSVEPWDLEVVVDFTEGGLRDLYRDEKLKAS